jgi:3-oxoacyl-(acyl-carrier-protein) synthase III
MRIIGTGSAHPAMAVTNDRLSDFLDTSDEWIQSRTGIRQRYFISDEKLEDIAAEAALKAIENACLASSDIDFIICANMANDYGTPTLSSMIQERIGASCPCIDIDAACAGFIYALDLANAYLHTGRMKNILIVCAEELSKMMDWKDRSTCILFGDGSGAAVVSVGDGYGCASLSTVGKRDVLYQKQAMRRSPFQIGEEDESGVVMNGREVYKMAVRYSTKDIESVLLESGVNASDINVYVLHQANKRIIETISSYLGQPMEKFPTDIEEFGNTSSASIPILLDALNREGKLHDGDLIMMSAFGAGFSSGACLLKWNVKH